MTEDGKERLAKVMAARGIASRRAAEQLILEGKVTVRGRLISHPGEPVDPKEEDIVVDGVRAPAASSRKAYYLYYKPKGYIVTRADPEGRKSIFDLLPELPARVEAVGRLDINTEGALLLTNDGELAHSLTHPSTEVPKRYLAKVWKLPTEEDIERLQKGVYLEDGKTSPAKVRVVKSTEAGNTWLELTVTEGRNRLVRRMFAAINHPVSKLQRVSFATISLQDMKVGDFRSLTGEEVQRLKDMAKGISAQDAGRETAVRKAGFARPSEKWMQKRVYSRKK